MPTAVQFDPDVFMAQRKNTAPFDPDAFMAKKRTLNTAAAKVEHPGFLQSAWNTLSAMPEGIVNTILHPIDSTEMGQFVNSLNEIKPEEWAKANADSRARAAGDHTAGMKGTPPTNMEWPTGPEYAGKLAGMGIGNAAMMGLGYGLGKLPIEDIKVGVKAAAPDVAKGTAKVAGGAGLGYAVSKLPIPGPVLTGMEVAPGYVMTQGARQILTGLRNGLEAYRGPTLGPEVMPKGFKTPKNYPEPYRPQDTIVRPPAARFEPTPRPAPNATPVPATETLTGRRPGGIQNQTAIESIVRQPAAPSGYPEGYDPKLLDDLTAHFTKSKTFGSLKDPKDRASILGTAGNPSLSQPLPKMTQPGSQPISVAPNASGLQQPTATTYMPDLEAKVIAPPIEPLASGAPMQPIAGNNINYPSHVHEQLHKAGPEVAITHGTNASAKDLAVAQRLKAAGITQQALDAMTDDALNKHFTALGYKKLGSDFAPGKRVGRPADVGRLHLRTVLGDLWK